MKTLNKKEIERREAGRGEGRHRRREGDGNKEKESEGKGWGGGEEAVGRLRLGWIRSKPAG